MMTTEAEGSAVDAARVAQPTDPSAAGNADTAKPDTEDFSTEAFDRTDRDPEGGTAGEGEGEGGEDTQAAASGDADKPRRDQGDDGLVEIEVEGHKLRVPPQAKDAFMRYGDYVSKNTEINQVRERLAAEQKQWEESRAALPDEHRKVAFLERDVAEAKSIIEAPIPAIGGPLKNINWPAYYQSIQGFASDSLEATQYRQLRQAYEGALLTVEDGERALRTAKDDLSAKEKTRLEEQTKQAEAKLAQARQETGSVLKAEGWDEPRFANVAGWAVQELGLGPEELMQVTDPRTWKMADRLMRAEADNAKLRQALGQKQTADANLKAQTSRPAAESKGNAQPTRVRDDISTAAWMERRNRAVAAKQAAGARR